MTIKPVLWNYIEKKSGKRKIYLRIITGEKTVYFDTGYRIAKSNWNGKKVTNIPNAGEINSTVERQCLQARDLWLENKDLDAAAIKRKLETGIDNPNSPDFFEFAWKFCDGIQTVGYRDAQKAKVAKFFTFRKEQPTSFEEITPLLLREYENYLYTLGNCHHTANKSLGAIRMLCNKAVEMNVIDYSPFKYKLPKFKQKKVIPLTRDEFELYLKLDIDNSGVHQTCIDSYYIQLFGFYTGVRISDRLLLKWENISTESKNGKKEKIIRLRTKKTNEDLAIRVHERLQKILDKYKGRNPKYVFPFITQDSTKEQVDTSLSGATALINKYLRKIAVMAGIDKRLSTHIARHTFTDELMSKTGSIAIAAQALGIDEKTTKAYRSRFADSRIDDVRDLLFQ